MYIPPDYELPTKVTFISSRPIKLDPEDQPPLWVVPTGNSSLTKTRMRYAEYGEKNLSNRRWTSPNRQAFNWVEDNTKPIQIPLVPVGFTRYTWDSGLILLVNNEFYFQTTGDFLQEIATVQDLRIGYPLVGDFIWCDGGKEGMEPILLDGPTARTLNLVLP